MKSARQESAALDWASGRTEAFSPAPDRATRALGSESASVTSIASYGDSFALTQRQAARLNASQVSDKELNNWLEERADLLDQLLDGNLTPDQKARLRFVEWNIDKIEDARSGRFLDVLEGFALKYEHFRQEIKTFQQEIEKVRNRR